MDLGYRIKDLKGVEAAGVLCIVLFGSFLPSKREQQDYHARLNGVVSIDLEIHR